MPVNPSDPEDEYFARQEFDRRKRALAEQDTRAAAAERERILAVAKNRCPKCGAPLITIKYRDVELDKCSECQGMWFDAGELDQVMAQESGGFLGGLKKIFG